jgi:hypothetical protein
MEILDRKIPWLKYFGRAEGVLVEEGAEGKIEFRELPPETGRALEEGFYAYGPKFLVIGGCVWIEQVGLALLHAFEDGSGDDGELAEIVMKGLVAAILNGKIDICERMCHFVEAHVLTIGVMVEFLKEMRPGKVNAVFAHMAFERHLIRPVAVFIPEDADGIKVVEKIVFQPEGELYGSGADEQGHAFFGFDIDIIKFLDFYEMQEPV